MVLLSRVKNLRSFIASELESSINPDLPGIYDLKSKSIGEPLSMISIQSSYIKEPKKE